MSNFINHPYHMVNESPWPILAAGGGIGLTSGLLLWFHGLNPNMFLLRLLILIIVSKQWWRDVSREGTLQGLHSKIVESGLRWGIVLFIISEIIFFLSFFWAFFHRRLAPAVELGSEWPPRGILTFSAFRVPLLNTIILLSSGISVTWAHHAILENNHSQTTQSLILTLILGVYFTAIQRIEYYEASFSFADCCYGSTFFIATGFHGLHVIVGSLFLAASLFRISRGDIRIRHHFGFEAAAWYWHFVDVVWLFLFITIYWWGGA